MRCSLQREWSEVGNGSCIGGSEELFVVGGGEDIVIPEEGEVVILEGWLQWEVGNGGVEEHGNEADVNNVVGIRDDGELVCDDGGRLGIGEQEFKRDNGVRVLGWWVGSSDGTLEPILDG